MRLACAEATYLRSHFSVDAAKFLVDAGSGRDDGCGPAGGLEKDSGCFAGSKVSRLCRKGGGLGHGGEEVGMEWNG